ncbi:MAG: tetratricopeptide repeat protein, partial [Bdellovibrionota bacterium]
MLNSPKVNKIFSSEKMKRFLLWFAAISLLGTLAFLLKDVSPHADTKNVYEGAVLLNQGAAETDSGNYEAALVLFNKALPMLDNKNKFKVYYNIGRTYNEKREPGKALINLDKSIELNSFCTYCFGERGRAYSQLEKADKAIENYTKAIELEPNNYIAYVNRAIEYSQINQEDKSMIDLKHAIVLSSDNPAVYIDLITSLMYNKKYTEAQEYINQFKLIIKSDDSFNYEQYLLFQSKLYYNLDDYKNLIPFAQEAIDKY